MGSNHVAEIQDEDNHFLYKNVQGKVVASCKRCGNISIDIGRCTECKKILPEGNNDNSFTLCVICLYFKWSYLLTGTEILPVPNYKPTEVEKNITKEKNQVKSIKENDKDADKQSNLPEGISEEAIKRREEYDKIAKKLKNSFKKKDKAWLKNLVDDDASLATKRILLSKLMEENHTHISQELATIRFGGNIFMRF